MAWKSALNDALRKTVGYELQRPIGYYPPGSRRDLRRDTGARLVPSPVFVISPVRSGSTLLRVLLDTHSQLHAPHELHLRRIQVHIVEKTYAELSVTTSGLEVRELEHLLWDRVLDHELRRSGKKIIVEKTPSNALIWQRLARAWPEARYVFLLRHPAAVAASWQRAHARYDTERVDQDVLPYLEAVREAQARLPGHTVRYEELSSDPARVLSGLCAFLGVEYEPSMLEYGAKDHGPLKAGLGDWSAKIKSGRVQPAPPPPPASEVRASLLPVARAWGYVDA